VSRKGRVPIRTIIVPFLMDMIRNLKFIIYSVRVLAVITTVNLLIENIVLWGKRLSPRLETAIASEKLFNSAISKELNSIWRREIIPTGAIDYSLDNYT
jgi:hypothetical protein